MENGKGGPTIAEELLALGGFKERVIFILGYNLQEVAHDPVNNPKLTYMQATLNNLSRL